MASNNQEVEVKFAVAALTGIEAKLVGLQASLEQPRLLEVNLRFDTPRRRLRKAERRLLRSPHLTVVGVKHDVPDNVGDEVAFWVAGVEDLCERAAHRNRVARELGRRDVARAIRQRDVGGRENARDLARGR